MTQQQEGRWEDRLGSRGEIHVKGHSMVDQEGGRGDGKGNRGCFRGRAPGLAAGKDVGDEEKRSIGAKSSFLS